LLHFNDVYYGPIASDSSHKLHTSLLALYKRDDSLTLASFALVIMLG